MIEKYSCYQFEVLPNEDVWVYVIFDPDYKPTLQTIIRESDEWYETESEAREGAIEHIDALESGER
jgi:hypothetical protein